MTLEYTMTPIAIAHTPYKDKFGVPRQPGLVTADQSYLRLLGDCNREEIVRGLEDFSHLWLQFVFDKAPREKYKPMVRPPRLGGNEKVGVFASRSPFRPNPLGLSVVELKNIEVRKKQIVIHISGADLVDGTPVLDIKPYLPYADAHPGAHGGYASSSPTKKPVKFSSVAQKQLTMIEDSVNLLELITQVIEQQPQPAFHKNEQQYGVTLYDWNIKWEIKPEHSEILSIERI